METLGKIAEADPYRAPYWFTTVIIRRGTGPGDLIADLAAQVPQYA